MNARSRGEPSGKFTADNSYGERLKHLRALADSEGQREHAGDRGKSGHGDGTKTPAASLNHGILRRKTEGAKAMLGVQEKDAVLGHDADDHDHAHEGRNVKRRASDQKSEQAAKGR